jgi:mycothiol maleylpyruvate isomerase-like protein
MTTRQTSDGPALMAAAAAETARMVNGAPGTAALDAPAPCADWDLRTLLNHTILWTAYSAERRAYSQNVAEELMSKDFTADPYRCDDALAGAVLTTVQAQAEMFRQYQGFADAVPVPEQATTFDRALSLSGRDPRWTP